VGQFFTDLACNIASTTLTSAAGGFATSMVDKTIEIISGTNFLTGIYTIQVRTDTNTVTIDRTACDGAGNASVGVGSLEFLSWLPTPPEVVRRPDGALFAEGCTYVDPLAYLPVNLDEWFCQHPEPLPRPRLGPIQYVVGPLEPTLILTPNMDTWFMQVSQPVRRVTRPIERTVVEVEAPHESIIPRVVDWLPVCTPPPVRPQPPQAGWWAGVLERTLFETPGLDTWFCQPPDPIRLPARIPLDRVEPPEWRPLAIGTQLLTWCVQSPDPVRTPWHPGEVTYVQPPAITPSDTILVYGETDSFKRTPEADESYERS